MGISSIACTPAACSREEDSSSEAAGVTSLISPLESSGTRPRVRLDSNCGKCAENSAFVKISAS